MTLKSSGPTTWQSLRMYWIPTIVPGIVVGCQVGLVGALSGVIVGEMLIGTGGVGEFIAEQRDQFNIAEMYSGIVSVCLMAIILTAAIRILARRTQRFQGA
jgi:ABC-type nitrate/sulfonate/bicarbonate transport system permease component